ncbi:hypothetical protein IEO21_07308 [Rhodonia placenta]|uniref:Uncharacterized protein n=1 Tax=Rhodonia placenta TaxID=104341 RepID=A0A8H7NYM3_9APHY|nr:hypothetical protein IEO21_07308 [Postia placenta]
MDCDRTERIEQIFQRVEEESERRARAEAEAEARAAQEAQEAQFSSIPAVTIRPAPPIPATSTSTSTSAAPGRRRGGSVSVSRFGQDVKHDMYDIMFAHDGSLASLTKPADAPPPVSSYVVHKQGFYQAQTHTTSADSLASLTPPDHADADTDADEEQVVLMETFAGRQSLSKAFSRRLSRSRSHSCDVFAAASSLVIGVRVEEATVEGELHGAKVAVAVAGGDEGVREKEQEKDRDAGREKGRWIGKARELSQKLRRRSTVVFTGSPLASPTAVSAGSI